MARPACRLPMLTVGHLKGGRLDDTGRRVARHERRTVHGGEVAPQTEALHKSGAVRVGGSERLHHGGADLPARVGVRPGDEPEHAVHGGHSVTQRLYLHSRGACVGAVSGW